MNNIDPNMKNLPFGDALSYGGSTLLLGMVTVFAVLIVIWISLIALKFFLHDIPMRKEAEKAATAESAPTDSEGNGSVTNGDGDRQIPH